MTTAPTTPTDPTMHELADIQGNVIGFKNDHQRLIFAALADAVSGKQFVGAMAGEVNTGDEVLAFNWRYWRRTQLHRDQLTEQSSWVNIGFTFLGLQALGVPELDTFPRDFSQGMAQRAQLIGDVDNSAPGSWKAPFGPADPAVHAVITIAADSTDLLEARSQVVRAIMAANGCVERGCQDGDTRPGDQAGHEHFGFRDGISQPGIRGLTTASKGGDEIAAGEFLIGYPDQDGHVSGAGGSSVPTPQPGQPGYGEPPPPAPAALPPWTRNGTFGAYRRLQQDVAGFDGFVSTQAPQLGVTPEVLAAKMVGRWKSGAPLERVPDEPASIDPAATDPVSAFPNVLGNSHINNFSYQAPDADGHAVPLGAHIRKTYPRDSGPGGEIESNRHRLLRRGIPYGPEFVAGEPAYGATGPASDGQDRGLLFVCYQASIADGFEFVQASWSNKTDFPQPGTGVDPIIAQNSANPDFVLTPNVHTTTARWVTTTGGCYFFVPSLTGLKHLST